MTWEHLADVESDSRVRYEIKRHSVDGRPTGSCAAIPKSCKHVEAYRFAGRVVEQIGHVAPEPAVVSLGAETFSFRWAIRLGSGPLVPARRTSV